MNGEIQYIEENLTHDIDFKEVARLAFCSENHFKRMFSFLADILRYQNTFVEDV